MSTDRLAALALAAGTLAGLVVMALHPTSSDVSRDIALGRTVLVVTVVHWLAIVAQPLLLGGMLAVTLRLRERRAFAAGAFIFFGVATVAIVIAAAASGLVSPGILRGMHGGDGVEADAMRNALHYTWLLNQAFASIYVVLGAIAIALWSFAILGGRELPRGLAIYGLFLGAALLVGSASGHLQLGIHGFGLVVLGQSVWMIWVAVSLWRSGEPQAEG